MGPNKNEPPNVSYFQLQSWFVSPFISDFRSPKCSRIIPSSRQESKINYKTTEKWAKLQPPFPVHRSFTDDLQKTNTIQFKGLSEITRKSCPIILNTKQLNDKKGTFFFSFFWHRSKTKKKIQKATFFFTVFTCRRLQDKKL